MESWIDQLIPIIDDFKGNTAEDYPLDGDDVDNLCEIIKAKINLNQGNLTQKEYDKLLK
jgi:hypothetical protein